MVHAERLKHRLTARDRRGKEGGGQRKGEKLSNQKNEGEKREPHPSENENNPKDITGFTYSLTNSALQTKDRKIVIRHA